MLKKILIGLGVLMVGIFVLWAVIVFPYPHLATTQIEVMKQELIDGILIREIKLRELYAKANDKAFVQTEAFKQQLQKEKEKFYKYCDNDGASEYKNEHCEITGYTQWDIFGRNPTRTLKYHFDEESQVFFNQIVTYMGYEKFSTNPTGDKKVWHDRFWRASEDEKLRLLYPTKAVGYSSEYNFENGSDRAYGYLCGQQELTLGNGEPVMKEDLLFITSYIADNKGASSGWGHDIKIGINTYTQRE